MTAEGELIEDRGWLKGNFVVSFVVSFVGVRGQWELIEDRR
jgi:hypothetical protein